MISHSAGSSLKAYFFQCQYALFESLKRSRESNLFSVSIETLDDIVYEDEDLVTDVIQIKYHNNKKRLTSSSIDFWKTIKIWIDVKSNSEDVTEDTYFYLITTETVSEDSIPYYFKPDSKNVSKAIEKMDKYIKETDYEKKQSSYKDIRKAFDAYNQMEIFEKEELFKKCFIIDQSVNSTEVKVEIGKIVKHACSSEKLEKFVDQLISRWMILIQEKLDNSELINNIEIDLIIDELREEFKRENLPVDQEIMRRQIDPHIFNNRTFVEQLELITLPDKTKFYAVKDYYQAREQRSKWARDGFLYPGEIENYDKLLKEEWEIHYDKISCIIKPNTEEEMIKAGQNIFYHFHEHGELIRNDFSKRFISRGSYHILSDDLEIGWHPQYTDKIKKSKR